MRCFTWFQGDYVIHLIWSGRPGRWLPLLQHFFAGRHTMCKAHVLLVSVVTYLVCWRLFCCRIETGWGRTINCCCQPAMGLAGLAGLLAELPRRSVKSGGRRPLLVLDLRVHSNSQILSTLIYSGAESMLITMLWVLHPRVLTGQPAVGFFVHN